MNSNTEYQTFAEKNFGISLSTLQFFFLCIVTMNFCYYYWMIKFSKSVCLKKDIKKFSYATFLAAGLFGWSLMIPSFVDNSVSYSTIKNIEILINIFTLTGSLICVYCSFKLKENLEKKLLDCGIKLKVSTIWSIILPFIYQYYIIINAETLYQRMVDFSVNSEKNESTIDQKKNSINYEDLEKLSKLKDSGVITEDEFSVQKKKILGESN